MKPNLLLKHKHGAIIHAAFALLFLLTTMTLKAQTPADFSGKWEFDKSRSGPDVAEPNYDGTVILEIAQSATNISFVEIYIHPDRSDWKTSAELYNLDGKEQVRKDNSGTNRRSTRWARDKKVLTITNLDTQTEDGVSQDFSVVDSLALSDAGQTLTIDRYRKNPVTGETRAKKVYRKK